MRYNIVAKIQPAACLALRLVVYTRASSFASFHWHLTAYRETGCMHLCNRARPVRTFPAGLCRRNKDTTIHHLGLHRLSHRDAFPLNAFPSDGFKAAWRSLLRMSNVTYVQAVIATSNPQQRMLFNA